MLSVVILLLLALSYWVSTLWAAQLITAERQGLGDAGAVPAAHHPAHLHHWLWLVLTERASQYSKRIRRAFWLARASLGLLPTGAFLTGALAELGYIF